MQNMLPMRKYTPNVFIQMCTHAFSEIRMFFFSSLMYGITKPCPFSLVLCFFPFQFCLNIFLLNFYSLLTFNNVGIFSLMILKTKTVLTILPVNITDDHLEYLRLFLYCLHFYTHTQYWLVVKSKYSTYPFGDSPYLHF